MSNYVITGASSEIGQALADHLAVKGHDILLVSRSEKKADTKMDWVDRIDLTQEADLAKLGGKIQKRFADQFNVVHSVGDFWTHKSITNTSFSEAVAQIQSHYITLYGVMKTVIPVMQNIGGGKIFAFSCNSVRYNYPDMAAFTSAKAAVECLIKCIANEQSKYNIIANAFALPSIRTKSVIETKPQEFWDNYVTLDGLVECLEKEMECISPLTNGNVISLFQYSDSFYHKGYYERNIIWEQ